jgi:hypothetical protein
MRLRRALLLFVAAAALAGGGCASDPTQGYALSSTFPEGVATVAVGIFENDTYERDIEFELADALVKEIEARTPYKVTSASRADTILTGRIRNVERDQLSKSRVTGLSEEVTLSVTIDLNWRDRRTGESLLELESFTAHSLFVPSRPTGEPIELAQFGAAQRLARDIVSQMQADW